MGKENIKHLKKHIEKYSEMTEEQMKEYLRNVPMRKYERLNYAFVRIDILLDYIKVIENHKSELQSPGSKVVVESGQKFDPIILKEYLILEITSFYNLLRKIKEKTKLNELPELPIYWKTIKDFRNQITAHLDKEEKFDNTSKWMEQYEKVDKVGIQKIVDQFKTDYFKCCDILKGDM